MLISVKYESMCLVSDFAESIRTSADIEVAKTA